jgi:hypothetical protein
MPETTPQTPTHAELLDDLAFASMAGVLDQLVTSGRAIVAAVDANDPDADPWHLAGIRRSTQQHIELLQLACQRLADFAAEGLA